jgi:hypothetical protein
VPGGGYNFCCSCLQICFTLPCSLVYILWRRHMGPFYSFPSSLVFSFSYSLYYVYYICKSIKLKIKIICSHNRNN